MVTVGELQDWRERLATQQHEQIRAIRHSIEENIMGLGEASGRRLEQHLRKLAAFLDPMVTLNDIGVALIEIKDQIAVLSGKEYQERSAAIAERLATLEAQLQASGVGRLTGRHRVD